MCGVYCSELGESRDEDSPSELHTYTHTHRGGSTVARGGQNPASFSYLWPIKSHVIWWLTLMGNGWNPSLSSSLIVSTLNGATVKIRWCHYVRSPLVATVQHLTLCTYTVCGFVLGGKKTDYACSNMFLVRTVSGGKEMARNVCVTLWGVFYNAGSFHCMALMITAKLNKRPWMFLAVLL